MILQIEISGTKKKEQEKRPILRKFVWKSIKLHRQCVCATHHATRGATFHSCGQWRR